MHDFFVRARRWFTYLDSVEHSWSIRWRAHANRRTLIVLAMVFGCGYFLYTHTMRPPESFPVQKLVSVDSGLSVSEVGRTLAAQKVIRSPRMFKFVLLLLGRDRQAHAGDYLFKTPMSVFGVARAILTGAYGLEPVRMRIAEGATVREMAEQYAARLQRFDAERFLRDALPEEGYLFPDTYYFLPNATDAHVLDTMRQNFYRHIAEDPAQIASSTYSLHDIVIMASLLEREARTTADRKMIAGVLWNRIQKNMPLQVDAAFLYTIGKSTFDLTKTDLRTDSPYNTYTNKGLPPTAIGSPSIDSLRAAAYPTPNGFYYYLADNNGVTYFSKTYAEHLRKKRLYLGT